MKPINQHIMIYGFMTLDTQTLDQLEQERGKVFIIPYKMTVRAKNTDTFNWTYFETSENTVGAKCDNNYDICTYFPVGFIPFIEYDMYDVAIEIKESDSLTKEHQVHLDFHMAYFNPDFTTEQLWMKLAFTWYTFLICFAFTARMLYVLFIKGVDAS